MSSVFRRGSRRWILITISIALLVSSLSFRAQPNGSIVVLSPSGAPSDVVGEGEDYFTLELGDPRDMNQRLDLRYQHLNVTHINVQNGLWTAYGGTRVFPLFPGFGDAAANIGQTGVDHPIDGNRFDYFSMRVSAGSSEPVYLVVHENSILDEQIAWHAPSFAANEMHTLHGTPDVTWPASIAGLRINLAGNPFVFDWVRLTDRSASPNYSIHWNATGVSQVNLYADVDRDPSVLDHLIAGNVNASSGSYSWATGYLAPGSYYVYIEDAGDPGTGAYSSGPLRIQPAPIASITAPSRSSGPDYATQELGNPWDMSSSADIGMTQHLSGISFSGGQMHATSVGDDPYIILPSAGPQTIETDYYKYLTWRLYIEGDWANSGDKILGDTDRWGVIRLLVDPSEADLNTFNDVIPWEGWHTYQMDLSRGNGTYYLDNGIPGPGPGWNGLRSELRWDPLEPHADDRWPIHLDYILLTADPRPQGSSYEIEWEITQGQPVTTTLLYSTSPNDACEAGTVIVELGNEDPVSPPGPYRVYLPVVRKDVGSSASRSYLWTDLPSTPGSYYVKIVLDDGLNRTCWRSNAPLVIEQ